MEKTVVKTLSLIEALDKLEHPVGVTALATALGLTKSNTYRLLDTLVRSGYVKRHEEVGQYELTLKLWRVGVGVLARLDIGGIARQHMEGLVNATRETVTLSVFDDGQVVYIAAVEGNHPIRAFTRVGDRRLAYCSAAGKVFLAYLSAEMLPKYCGRMKRFTSKTVTDLEELKKELARVRKNGYATNLGEWREDVCGVAAPVWSSSGTIAAAIGIVMPKQRMNDHAVKACGKQVIEYAKRISAGLGYDSPIAQHPRYSTP
jgi:IclR family KDG regulon transcriptional repressor